MATANLKTRRTVPVVHWTMLVISTVGAGRTYWEIGRKGADTGRILLLGTFLVVGLSNVLLLTGLHRQARREAGSKNCEQIIKPGKPEAYSVS